MPDKEIPIAKSPRKRGRPPHNPEEKKQSHTITLSDEAWKNLETISREWGLGSVSQLIENVGVKKYELMENTNSKENLQTWHEQKEEAANAFWAAQYLQCDFNK